jgi:hypothetical protein
MGRIGDITVEQGAAMLREAHCRTFIELRLRPIEFWFPPVEIPSPRVDEGDFVFQPEQGPLAPILANGHFIHSMRAIDFDDRPAGDSMPFKKP